MLDFLPWGLGVEVEVVGLRVEVMGAVEERVGGGGGWVRGALPAALVEVRGAGGGAAKVGSGRSVLQASQQR